MKTKILFVSAIPDDKNYIDIGQESDTISEVLEVIKPDCKFQFIHKHGIIRGKFREILQDYKPEIIHFSGHGGDREGLVFQDNEEISSNILKEIFENLHNIQLIYLNACYSAKQIVTLKDLSNVENIIGMNKSINDYIAIQFSTNFYKNLKKIEKIQQAFTDTFNNFKQEYPDIVDLPVLVKLHETEKEDIVESLQNTIYIKKKKSTRTEQNTQIAIDLISQIERSIKIFDEEIIRNEINPEEFWKSESSINLSKIVIILDTYSEEYNLSDIELKILRTNYRMADNLFKILSNKSKFLQIENKEKIFKNLKNNYYNIIKVLQKILYNYKLDSIQKIQPLYPQTNPNNLFFDVLYKINSISISLNTLKNKILQHIMRNDDMLVKSNSISEYNNIIFHLKIEYSNLTKFIETYLDPDLVETNIININLFSNLCNQLKINQINRISLYESLDNIYNIQGEFNRILHLVSSSIDNNNIQKKLGA